MTEPNEHAPSHTLSELLQDQGNAGDRAIKGAKSSAPFIVIAIMAHVIVGAVMSMLYFHNEKKEVENNGITVEQHAVQDIPKIEEKKEEAPKEIEPTAIPKVEETNEQVVPDDNFNNVVDDTVNQYATENTKFGVSEGESDESNLMTMSSGGKGLAGAIGLGAGSGAGGGARRGSPLGGSRIGRRNAQKGQLETTEKAVNAGLEWLRRHQSPDGSWSGSGYMQNCDGKKGAACTGRGSAVFDTGLTGLALLAFLGAGYDSSKAGPYNEVVKKGLKYLKGIQDADGAFGPRGDPRFTYSHACATLAMCEGYASSKQTPWKKPAQSGIDFIAQCQNPYKAWRYGVKPGDNDSSVTGWMLMALHSGKDAGLAVNERVMKDGLAFVDSMTDEENGRTGYTKKGEIPVRPEGLTQKWPGTESESLTAVAMCSRIFCEAADGNPLMKKGAELLKKKPPAWDEAGGKIDMYYWYYGTLAMFQVGGQEWQAWERALKPVVVDNQIKTGCTEGSWDPKDPWGDEGGRVYSTGIMTLCLEAYYRYPKLFGTKKVGGGAAPAGGSSAPPPAPAGGEKDKDKK